MVHTGQLEGMGHGRLADLGRNGGVPDTPVLIHGYHWLYRLFIILLFGRYFEPFLGEKLGGSDRYLFDT